MNAKKCFLILILAYSSITAQEVIDQSQLNYNSSEPIGILDFGQGFTASSNKKITKIEVQMDCGSTPGCAGQQYYLNLFDASADFKPIGNALFFQSGIGFNGGDGEPVWQTFQLANGPTMVLGNRYVIVVSDNGNSTDFGWLQASNNPYSGGQAIYRLSGSSNSWNILTSQDFVFKVWIENTLGMEEELFLGTRVKVFFNSALSILKIDSNVDFKPVLYDLIGNELMNFDVLSNSSNHLDVSTLSKGVYIVKSKNKNILFTKKICIQ